MLDQNSLAALEARGVRNLWHFTSIDNLPGIIVDGLLPRSELAADSFSDVAYADALELRSRMRIPCRLCGTGHGGLDLVPLFLAYKNPMTYVRKSVPRTCLLRVNIESLLSLDAHMAFTDGNLAATTRTTVLTNADDLNQVDWEILVANYWGPLNELTDAENSERRRRRAAEFLVFPSVPSEAISLIAVRNEADRDYMYRRMRDQPGARERIREREIPLKIGIWPNHFYG